jgi:hypothetical protein
LAVLLVVGTVNLFVHWMLKKQVRQRVPFPERFQLAIFDSLSLGAWERSINVNQRCFFVLWTLDILGHGQQALAHLPSMWLTRWPQSRVGPECVHVVRIWERKERKCELSSWRVHCAWWLT